MYHGADVLVLWDVNRLLPIGSFKSFYPLCVVACLTKDFIDGALGTPEAQAIVPAAAARIRACREAGYTLIATLDTHTEDYLNTPEGKKLPVPHCIRGTEGWRLNPAIEAELKGCALVEKPTFGSVRLPGLVKELAGDAKRLSIQRKAEPSMPSVDG